MIATIALASASEGPEWDALSRRADRVRPTPEETRWMQIPWVRSVVDGQRMARAEKRPIMYWHVDDDPLERC
jgi:hypothetical protein